MNVSSQANAPSGVVGGTSQLHAPSTVYIKPLLHSPSVQQIITVLKYSLLKMENQKLAMLVLILLQACSAAATARVSPLEATRPSLEVRLKGRLAEAGERGGLVDCWGALLELRACTNEIVLFFLNGEGYIGQGCCRAIRIITHRCWPTMLTSLGFSVEEGDILRDYCKMGDHSPPPPPTTPPQSPTPTPAPAPTPYGPPLVPTVAPVA